MTAQETGVGTHIPAVIGPKTDAAVLAGGCFWCLEAVFRELDGILKVEPGYCGGTKETADYRQVCTGGTDHAEAVRIEFDQNKISYEDLLKVFFSVAHDPTQKDRQGNDRGRQYRSAIFYRNPDQKHIADDVIEKLTDDRVFNDSIVTEVVPLQVFYPAETYHHNYAACHPDQPYIAHVSTPKVEKLRRYFVHMLRADVVS